MPKTDKPSKTPEEILKIALAKEQQAHRFYQALLNRARTDVLTELLTHLMNEEHKHIKLIERKITALNLGRPV